MATDTIQISYPCYVLTTHPFRFTEHGEQILEHSTFMVIDASDGTPFLALFRNKKNLSSFVFDTDGCGDVLHLELDSPQKLAWIVKLASDSRDAQIGLLVDPDLNLRGYPIGPDDVAKLLEELGES